MKKTCGIYKITNQVNSKVYIGQSKNIEKRWQRHSLESFKEKSENYNYPLYQAIRKYSLENFTFEIIEECLPEELNKKEIDYISFYESYPPEKGKGYNQTPGGDCGKSFRLSEEQIILLLTDLRESNLTIKEIADKFQLSIYAVYDFNKGVYYTNNSFQYPIRQKSKKRTSKNAHKIAQIKEKNESSTCISCGKEISPTTKNKICNECFRKKGMPGNSPFRTHSAKVQLPSKEELLKQL